MSDEQECARCGSSEHEAAACSFKPCGLHGDTDTDCRHKQERIAELERERDELRAALERIATVDMLGPTQMQNIARAVLGEDGGR